MAVRAMRSYASMARGGARRTGYIDKYDARDRASTELTILPEAAAAIACKIAQFVKTLVGCARQVTIVNGLKMNLVILSSCAFKKILGGLTQRRPHWNSTVIVSSMM